MNANVRKLSNRVICHIRTWRYLSCRPAFDSLRTCAASLKNFVAVLSPCDLMIFALASLAASASAAIAR